jgi:protein MpaA
MREWLRLQRGRGTGECPTLQGLMERLGRNKGRYDGDPIDIDAVQRETHELAIASGWIANTFLDIPEIKLRGYRRPFPGAKRNLYIGAGIHGDEPSGPTALVQLLRENQWPDVNLWLVPCVNPTGYRLNTRENKAGIDLNRNYREPTALEVISHIEWLNRQPRFDLSLQLHEDWEANGFYLYELNPENRPSLANSILEAVRSLCPIERADRVDDFVCNAGIIRPQVIPEKRSQWAEAVYLIANKTRQSYTLETPSDFALPLRVRAHVVALREALRAFASQGGERE